jgi:DNA-binding NarL/FixJ family response regulator
VVVRNEDLHLSYSSVVAIRAYTLFVRGLSPPFGLFEQVGKTRENVEVISAANQPNPVRGRTQGKLGASLRGIDASSQNEVGAIESFPTPRVIPPAKERDKPSVLVADDDLGTRHGMGLVLEAAGLDACAGVADADSAIEEVRRKAPDICLVDLRLPGGGLKVASWICGNAPQTAVVLIADDVTDEELFDSLRIGAAGFVFRSMNRARLPDVLRGVLRGEAALPRELVGRVVQEFRERGRRRHFAIPDTRGVELTSREWEVLELLHAGQTTRKVAERLGIAQVTVRRHIGEILRKLRVTSREDALALLDKRSSI